MRIILSRKGFDSSAGGCPSPILPDGRLCSLPIPDPASSITYGAIDHNGGDLGELLRLLTGNPEWRQQGAHLDPDLRAGSLPRLPGWKPMLGQSGSAQGHLRNEGVAVGDLFLFFGSFRSIQAAQGRWRFNPAESPLQVIWGWLQVSEILKVDDLAAGAMPWTRYHPHFAYAKDATNTLYVASETLCLDGLAAGYPGAGSFSQLDPRLVLTDPGSTRQTRWKLPAFFAPRPGRPGLSFHRNPDRWTLAEDSCLLNSAFRGQEFVFDIGDDEAPLEWLRTLLPAL